MAISRPQEVTPHPYPAPGVGDPMAVSRPRKGDPHGHIWTPGDPPTAQSRSFEGSHGHMQTWDTHTHMTMATSRCQEAPLWPYPDPWGGPIAGSSPCRGGASQPSPPMAGGAHVGDEGAEALDDVGAVVALEHHVQVHQDPLVLLPVP